MDLKGVSSVYMKQDCLGCGELDAIFKPMPYILAGQLLGALIVSALVYQSVGVEDIKIWLLMNVAIFLFRMYCFYTFKSSASEEKLDDKRLWLSRYYTNTIFNGIIWGSSAFLAFSLSSLADQAVLIFLLITTGSISIIHLITKWKFLMPYLLLTFAPIVVRLFMLKDTAHANMAYSILVALFILLIFAKYNEKMVNYFSASVVNYVINKDLDRNIIKRLFSVLNNAPVGIFHFDKNMIIDEANANVAYIFGLKESSDIIGKPLEEVWPDEKVIGHHKKVLKGFEVMSPSTIDIKAPKSSKEYHINLFSIPMQDVDGETTGGISILSDKTSEDESKKDLERLKHYDALTSLPNRELLLKNLKKSISTKLRQSTFGAVLFLDIDHFNNINRSYGQNTGDKVLKKIAIQLLKTIDDKDTVARIGADTFVFLLPELVKDREKSKQLIFDFVAKLRESFKKVLVVGDADYYIGFTAGASLFDNNDLTSLELLKYAESALIETKEKARGSVRFYEKERNRSALYDLSIAKDIHKAIKNNELSMYYQPQQDIHSGILTGAEALVRWNHPQKGNISPAHFIPIAEESGAIIQLEEWIFNQVFKDMRSMTEVLTEFPLNYIAVNVTSSHFLQPNFVEKFTELVHKYRINPLWINIEITESGLMRDIDEAIERIHELKRLGFGFSIDDFGTGYSSLTYLKELPVDIIKIDRSFVKDADKNEGDRLIVESVIEISQKFGFKVLAEGIDRQETLDYFKTTSCKAFQGYLYYKPLSMEQFIQII